MRVPAPGQLGHVFPLLRPQQVGSSVRGNDRRSPAFQAPQRRQVEVVHMGVREQHHVDFRQPVERHRRFYQPLEPERQRTEIQPDPRAEYRIGENRCAVHLE